MNMRLGDYMLEHALELLKEIEAKGFKAYIVGGYPRDLYLERKSLDIDICTSATPKDLIEIFPTSKMANAKYGAVSLIYHKIRFEFTTFRKEIKYENHRQPIKIEYIDSLIDDLKRRDFTINTICIDSNGQVLDLLNAKPDLDAHIIQMVGNSSRKLKEDALRILRAVRFATTLNFTIDESLKKDIKKQAHLVKKLSYYRKKEELDKIFVSTNVKYGISLLTELSLLPYLDIPNLNEIVITDSIIGIWAQLNTENYLFTSHEQAMIDHIRELLTKDLLDLNTLYQYGLYECEVAGTIKGMDIKAIVKRYNELYIHSKSEIAITASEINELLSKPFGPYLTEIFNDLELSLINQLIQNDKTEIKKYILNKYKTTK